MANPYSPTPSIRYNDLEDAPSIEPATPSAYGTVRQIQKAEGETSEVVGEEDILSEVDDIFGKNGGLKDIFNAIITAISGVEGTTTDIETAVNHYFGENENATHPFKTLLTAMENAGMIETES